MERVKSFKQRSPRLEVIGEGQNTRIVFHNPTALRQSFSSELAKYLAVSRDTRLVLNPSSIARPEAIADFSAERSSFQKTRELGQRIKRAETIYIDSDI